MGIFINPDREIKIVVNVAKDEKGNTIAYPEGVPLPADLKINDSKKHELIFRYPNYLLSMEIADSGTAISDRGIAVKMNQIRFFRMVKLLKNWDFTDESGVILPVTAEQIAALDPMVGAAISYGLEEALGITEG